MIKIKFNDTMIRLIWYTLKIIVYSVYSLHCNNISNINKNVLERYLKRKIEVTLKKYTIGNCKC